MAGQRNVLGPIAATVLIGLLSMLGACAPGTQQGVGSGVTPADWAGATAPVAGETEYAPVPTLVLESGKGAVVGRVILQGASWQEVRVYLAPFYHVGADDRGFYVLEPSIHPQAPLRAGGFFQIVDVPPGYYVIIIVVGLDPLEGVVAKVGSEPRIIQVLPDEVVHTGEVSYGEE